MTDLANLFTDHKMSSRPIRAKYKHVKTICEQTSDNSPTDSKSSFFELMVVQKKVEKLYKVGPLCCLPIQSIAQRSF